MRIGTFIASMLCLLGYCKASTIYVDVNGPNMPGTGNSSDPFRRIQDALDFASDGDVIVIAEGIYTGDANNRNLNCGGKSLIVRSTEPNNVGVVANTVIDANGLGRCLYFDSGEDSNCIISGLTMRNGYSITSAYGGCIYCYESSPTIRNCVIAGGQALYSGGGIHCHSGSPRIINCVIRGNLADYGGGVSCYNSSLELAGCMIVGNRAGSEGGGVDWVVSEPVVSNCIIIGNKSQDGGGMNCYSPGEGSVINCTISGNESSNLGGGIYCQDGSSTKLINCIVWGNDANDSGFGPEVALDTSSNVFVSYSNVRGGQAAVYDPCGHLVWGVNNIDVDPCFAGPAYWDVNGTPADANDDFLVEGDYHLKSQAGRWCWQVYVGADLARDGIINLVDFAVLADFWQQEEVNVPADIDGSGKVDFSDLALLLDSYLLSYVPGGWVYDDASSPCIDAGDPNSDWTGEPWPNGKRTNIGAYGGTSEASKSGNEADFNVDGIVDFLDFSQFASRWMSKQACIEELNGDGEVEFIDLRIFAENWLWEKG